MIVNDVGKVERSTDGGRQKVTAIDLIFRIEAAG